MSIRYVDQQSGEAGIPRFVLRIDNAGDFAVLPTMTVEGSVIMENGAAQDTLAAIGSRVASDDLTIIGELQSDNAWHTLGV